jgi:exosortase A-associated hydrolase 2
MTLGVCCDESVRPAPQPFFLEGGLGPLFCLLFAPAPNMLPRGTILYLPPFAEEANRSRRMAVLQAGRLAARGWAVLLLDPFGTGDSAGEFREARWDQWLADAGRAANWLAACWPDRPITLWGLRLGALLAADLAARETNRFSRLLFWQPLLRGDRFITQFLRLRTAAAMTVGEKESSEDLRARLADDEILEVAGYELAPDLVATVEALRLEDLLKRLGDTAIEWLELASSGSEPALLPASRRLLDTFPAGGGPQLTCKAVTGDAFWAIQEITLAPQLLDATDAIYS